MQNRFTCPSPRRRFRGSVSVSGSPAPAPGPAPAVDTRTPLFGNMAVDNMDGFGLGNTSPPGEFKTARANQFADAMITWGMNIQDNQRAAGDFASGGAFIQYVNDRAAANFPLVDTDITDYVNTNERASGSADAPVINRPGIAPSQTNPGGGQATWTDGVQNRGLTAWLLNSAGQRLGAFSGTYALNLTSAAPRVNIGNGQTIHIAQYLARRVWAGKFGHTAGDDEEAIYGSWNGMFAAIDNCFGYPKQTGDYRNNGTNLAGNSATLYTWPDGRTETIGAQHRRGYMIYCDELMALAAAAGIPFKVCPNVEQGSTVLDPNVHPEFFTETTPKRPKIHWALIEQPIGGPWHAADDEVPNFWNEYNSRPPGSPDAGFQNGSRFAANLLKMRSIRDGTIEKRILILHYANRNAPQGEGVNWMFNAINQQDARYILCAGWLSDGMYPDFSPGANPATGMATGPVRMDETKAPLGIPIQAEPTAPLAGSVLWARRYSNGLVLVNPTTTDNVSLTLSTVDARLYKRLNAASYGNQAPTVNDGADVTTVTVKAKSGLLLLLR